MTGMKQEISLPDIPGYGLSGIIGKGGMGAVYKGERVSDGRPVAVKVIKHVQDGNAFLRRFAREIKVSAAFAHPYVIKILDTGKLEGNNEQYLVMEYLEGQSLAEAAACRTLSPEKALDIARKMTEALSYVHARKVLHRDIKPGNVFLENSGRVVLLDFGLALASGYTRMTATDERLGTICTMAPEQLLCGEVDNRSDLYSLGVTLFYALTSGYPFSHDDFVRIITGGRIISPPLVNTLNKDVSFSFARVISRCLEHKPESRYQSAEELGLALDSLQTPRSGSRKETGRTGRCTTVKGEAMRAHGAGPSADRVLDGYCAGRADDFSNSPGTGFSIKLVSLLVLVSVAVAVGLFSRRSGLDSRAGQTGGQISVDEADRELTALRDYIISLDGKPVPGDLRLAGLLARRLGILERLSIGGDICDAAAGLYFLARYAGAHGKPARSFELFYQFLEEYGPCGLGPGHGLVIEEVVRAADLADRLGELYPRLKTLRKENMDETSDIHLSYAIALTGMRINGKHRDRRRVDIIESSLRQAKYVLVAGSDQIPGPKAFYVYSKLLAKLQTARAWRDAVELINSRVKGRRTFGMDSSRVIYEIVCCITTDYRERSEPSKPPADVLLALLEKALSLCGDPGGKARIKLRMAREYERSGHPDKALVALLGVDRSRLVREELFNCFSALGRIRRERGETEKALMNFKKALSYAPSSSQRDYIRDRMEGLELERRFLFKK